MGYRKVNLNESDLHFYLYDKDKEFVSDLLKQVDESEKWANSNKEKLGDYCEQQSFAKIALYAVF